MTQENPFKGLSIGRMVHYVDEGQAHNAAIVIDVLDDQGLVHLFVLARNGNTYPVGMVPFSFSFRLGSWHWPERED